MARWHYNYAPVYDQLENYIVLLLQCFPTSKLTLVHLVLKSNFLQQCE